MIEAVIESILEDLKKDLFNELKSRLSRAFNDLVRDHARQMEHRGKQLDERERALKQREKDLEKPGSRLDECDNGWKQPIGLLFTNQISCHVGMLSSVKDIPAVKDMLASSERILGFDVLKICTEGPKSDLHTVSQPVTFIAGLAAVEKMRSEKTELMKRHLSVAGFSVGEYIALCAARVLTFEDGLKLVRLRGEAMQAAGANKQMTRLVAGLEKQKILDLCDKTSETEGMGKCQISAELCPRVFEVCGTLEAIQTLRDHADKSADWSVEVSTGTGLHTPLMKPLQEKLFKAFDECLPNMRPPRCPVYMNATGEPVQPGTNPKEIVRLLKLQSSSPVLWEKSIRAMIRDGITDFYDLGPSDLITFIMDNIDAKVSRSTTWVEV